MSHAYKHDLIRLILELQDLTLEEIEDMNKDILENVELDLVEQESKIIKKITTTKLPPETINFTYIIHALHLRQSIPIKEFVAFLSACGIERGNEVQALTTFIYFEDDLVNYFR